MTRDWRVRERRMQRNADPEPRNGQRVTAAPAAGVAARGAVALLAVLCCGLTARAAAPSAAITPDARVQAIIDRAAHATTEAELADEVRALAALAATKEALVPQLVYYAMQQHETHAAMVPAILRQRLRITDVQLTEGLLPYLATPDPTLRAQLYNWLGAVDAAGGSTRDFAVYRTVITAHHGDPPLALVRYMYDTDADAAVVILADVYGQPAERQAAASARRPVRAAWAGQRAAGHLDAARVAPARAALQTLSADSAWWVRLYAATAVAQMPDLATPELLARLRADSHPLVRAAVPGGG